MCRSGSFNDWKANMSSIRQEQQGGLGSTNVQIHKVDLHQGVSVDEAHQIARSVFEANFWRVHDTARQVANERAAEMREQIISDLARQGPEALDQLNDPDRQVAFYEAQKSYALTGDQDLKALLSRMVIEIAAERGRTLRSIVLKEAVTILPKLTANQMKILALKYLVRGVIFKHSNSVSELVKPLYIMTAPFLAELRFDSIQFRHLIYTGCGESSIVDILHIAVDLRRMYPKLFSKMKEDEVSAALLAAEPRLAPLVQVWNESAIGGLRLTSVGLLIAETFVSKRSNVSIEPEVWA